MHLAWSKHEHCGQSHRGWFASFVLIVQSRWHFWDCKPEGAQELPPSWSKWRVRGHELVGRCGRPWTPNPKIIDGQRFQSSDPTSLRKLRHLRKAVWIMEALKFLSVDPAFSMWPWLGGERRASNTSRYYNGLCRSRARYYPIRFCLIFNFSH